MPQSAYPAGSDPTFTLTTGPIGATPATLAALGRPILNHLDPAFGALYEQTVELLRLAFETGSAPVILQGEAVVGLEAAAASLIGAADVVLNLVSGMYGRGYAGPTSPSSAWCTARRPAAPSTIWTRSRPSWQSTERCSSSMPSLRSAACAVTSRRGRPTW